MIHMQVNGKKHPLTLLRGNREVYDTLIPFGICFHMFKIATPCHPSLNLLYAHGGNRIQRGVASHQEVAFVLAHLD